MNVSCLPDQFVEKLKALYPEDMLDAVLESFTIQKPISIRINTLKTTKKEVIDWFTQHHIAFEPIDFSDLALILPQSSSREITDLTIYKEGKIYIQSLSSMIPALMLAPQQNEKILDIAAAPGSKTSQIAALMENTGEIVANDIDRNRLFKLKAVLKEMGVTNTKVVSYPGQMIWEKYPEYFDRVLLDAPCSMEGRFDCNDPATIEHWSQKKVKNLAKLQKWLLRSAVSATKVGGIIVYSTCTISPEENEEVINWIREKEQKNIELIEMKRIPPDQKMEAFFVSTLKKVHSNISSY